MRFFTYSSLPLQDNRNLSRNRQPWMMVESTQYYEIPLEVLLWPADWSGRTHIARMIDVCRSVPRNEIILFSDGWDVFYNAGPQEILDKFLAADTPVLLHAERQYWSGCEDPNFPHPRSPTSFGHVNGGGVVAYAGAFADILSAPDFWPAAAGNNQMALEHWYDHHPDTCKLDHYCHVFQWYYSGVAVDVVGDRVVNFETNSKPSIIHGCGGHAFWASEMWRRVRQLLPNRNPPLDRVTRARNDRRRVIARRR